MSEISLTCPHCQHRFSLGEATEAAILEPHLATHRRAQEELVRKQAEAQQALQAERDEAARLRAEAAGVREKAMLDAEARIAAETQRAREAAQAELQRVRDSLQVELQRAREAADAEVQRARDSAQAELQRAREAADAELQRVREAMAAEVDARIAAATAQATAQAQAEASRAAEAQLRDSVAKARLEAIATAHAEFELQRKELLAQRDQADLEAQRRLQAEVERARAVATEQAKLAAATEALEARTRLADELNALRVREAENKVQHETLTKTIHDLQQQLAAKPNHVRGEAQERLLRDELVRTFDKDVIRDVPKGTRGADLVHEVRDPSGPIAGKILWECKRTKTFNREWISKVKDDQRAMGAEVAVIVTATLPENITSFGLVDGVWVTNWECFGGLAIALRETMIQTFHIRRQYSAVPEKAAELYRYATGPEFQQAVSAIAKACTDMQNDLRKERAAAERAFKKRDKQLQRIAASYLNIDETFATISGKARVHDEDVSDDMDEDDDLDGDSATGPAARDSLLRLRNPFVAAGTDPGKR